MLKYLEQSFQIANLVVKECEQFKRKEKGWIVFTVGTWKGCYFL